MSNRNLFVTFFVGFSVLLAAVPATTFADAMMLWRSDGLEAVKAGLEAGRSEAQSALEKVVAEADAALLRGPLTVVDKTGFRGGDIHDYYSQGPYWWPDPDSPDGLPYIRRDGVVNPEKYGDGLDSKRRHDMVQDVTALSLAGYFTGKQHYLEHAAQQIRAWFIAPSTRMNPNMNYAQSIPGRSAGRPTGIIDSRVFVDIIDAALLLHEGGALDDSDIAALKTWYAEMADWLENSENGRGERATKNNHATFYDLQLAAFHWFAGDPEAAADVVGQFCTTRIERQVEADGSQPHELARTRPYHYSMFNLKAMVNMALLARRLGLDTDQSHCSIEAGIRRALGYVADHTAAGRDWPDVKDETDYVKLYELLVLFHALTDDQTARDRVLAFGDAFDDALIHLQIPPQAAKFKLVKIERPRILGKAAEYLAEVPLTVTTYPAERSEGGLHDFYSEGDYWWPDPDNPDGPYLRKDGMTNPDNFVAHRRAMVRLSEIVGTLASAYIITGEDRFAAHANSHLQAWFVDEETRMNPSLLYGQAIKGKVTGRSIGIIDTIHLTEVARGAKILGEAGAIPKADFEAIKAWFSDYLDWLTTHPYGTREQHHPNNHGVCWSMQAAAFADLVGRTAELEWIRNQFKTVYLQEMMAEDGGFPKELARTKPYGYSLFVLDAMAMVAQIASSPEDDLWTFALPDGRSMARGLGFLFPYVLDKTNWPYAEDVLYWDEWPVRHPSMLFGGLQLDRPEYLESWKSLEADPKTAEVIRNLPIRHPLLWVEPKQAEWP